MRDNGWTQGQVLSVLAHVRELSRVPLERSLPASATPHYAIRRIHRTMTGRIGPEHRRMAEAVKAAASHLTGLEAEVVSLTIRNGLTASQIARRLHRRKTVILRAYREAASAIAGSL